MKRHLYFFALLLTSLFTVKSISAQQVIELPDSAVSYEYESTGLQWGHQIAGTFYSWNSDNNISTITSRIWDSGHWRDTLQERYTYDGSGHLSSHLSLRANGSRWDSLEQQVYHYDLSGSLTERLELGYYYPNEISLHLYRYHGDPAHPYSKTNMVMRAAHNYWDSTGLELYSNTTPIDTQRSYSRDTVHNQWYATGNMIIDSAERHIWIYGTGGDLMLEMFKSFDSYGHLVAMHHISYQNGTSHITTQVRYLYNLDPVGRILSEEYQYYDNAWQSDYIYTCTYDSLGRTASNRFATQSGLVYDSTYVYDNMGYVDHSLYYYTQPGQPLTGDSTQYYYHRALTTGVQQALLAADIAVYPIPAHHDLIIDIHTDIEAKLISTLTDMTGRKVAESAVAEGRNHFDVSTLAAGIYTLSLSDGQGNRQERKVVLQ